VETIAAILKLIFMGIGAMVIGGCWTMVVTMIGDNRPALNTDKKVLWMVVSTTILFLTGFDLTITIGWLIGTALAALISIIPLGGYMVVRD
jgi:hypothetical protein